MRRQVFRSPESRALELFHRAPVIHLATTTPEGAPVLRALDGVLLDEGVCFHGARAGEKARCLDRPAVVSAEELVAHLPSWMIHPTQPCPASTLYRSVQVHGTLREVTDPDRKVAVLMALMRRWQPEGRYLPLDPAQDHDGRELGATLVFAVDLERVDGKEKLCQNRAPEETLSILAGLWRRGAPGDVAAIEIIREANPGLPTPPFLAAEGVRLQAALGREDVAEVEALLRGEYWWAGTPAELVGPVHLASPAWVGARAPDGALVGSARATSDGKTAWVYDVVVAPAWRGRGLGQRLMTLLLDHPAVRGARAVMMRTRDAQGLYARFGFVDTATLPKPWPTASDMVLRRPGA